jgi:peptide deformylase
MAILPIIIAPDPRLRRKSVPLEGVDDAVRKLVDDMFETMYAAPGVGLAAPQVGIPERLVVMDIAGRDEPPKPLVLANPEILSLSDSPIDVEEGCLSVPDHYAIVERHDACKLRYLDFEGASREMEAEGFLAACIQHELDHLEGVLFIDRISALKRNMILRKLAKARKQKASAAA